MKFADLLFLDDRVDLQRLGDDILRLNEHFRRTGDPARVRYAYLNPGRAPDWNVVLWLTLELPPAHDGDEAGRGLRETHYKYQKLVIDFFIHDHPILATCQFRTAEQLAASPPRRGVPVPETADHA